MTLLASWIGVDTHGPSSAYIVADSRITWSQVQYYDYGKKVFASKSYPEIFGYAGDVLFPSIVLSQILEMIDSGLLFRPDMSCHDKNGIVYEKLCHSFSKYPDAYGDNPIQVIHISRETVFQGYPSFYHYSSSDVTHIQLKYSINKQDASFLSDVIKNFLEAYLLDQNRVFKPHIKFLGG